METGGASLCVRRDRPYIHTLNSVAFTSCTVGFPLTTPYFGFIAAIEGCSKSDRLAVDHDCVVRRMSQSGNRSDNTCATIICLGMILETSSQECANIQAGVCGRPAVILEGSVNPRIIRLAYHKLQRVGLRYRPCIDWLRRSLALRAGGGDGRDYFALEISRASGPPENP